MRIKIIGPVKRNGKLLPLDETISISDAEALALIAVGAAELVSAKAKPEPGSGKGKAETAGATGKEDAEDAEVTDGEQAATNIDIEQK